VGAAKTKLKNIYISQGCIIRAQRWRASWFSDMWPSSLAWL